MTGNESMNKSRAGIRICLAEMTSTKKLPVDFLQKPALVMLED